MKKHWLLLLLGAVLLSGCTGVRQTDAQMTSFIYTHSGMNSGSVYTWEACRTEDGAQARISLLGSDATFECVMEEADYTHLGALVDRYDLWRWAGFDKTNSLVLDGESFTLDIRFADGTRIPARGSNRFPDGYRGFADELHGIFSQYIPAE